MYTKDMLYNIALYIHNTHCYGMAGRKNDGPDQLGFEPRPNDFLVPVLNWFDRLIPPP